MEAFTGSYGSVGVLAVKTRAVDYVYTAICFEGKVCSAVGKVPLEELAAAGFCFFRPRALLAGLYRAILSRETAGRDTCVADLMATALKQGMCAHAWSVGTYGENYVLLGDPDHVKV